MKTVLKKLREYRGLTQQELSRDLHVAPSAVGLWEQGRRLPDYANLRRIARYFGVTTDYLLGNEVVPPTSDDENRLLDQYRQLTANDKQFVHEMIDRLVPA